MSVLRYLLGRPLDSREENAERVGVFKGVAVFGLDALGSAAYGPEAALTVLIPAGLLGLHYLVPLSGTILLLLLIVYLSYRQTISAYPNGGGAYTVAGQNLGSRLGMLAAAALMLDYLLNVAVGISTGIGALISALPQLQAHTLALCLGVLVVITFANLRGVSEAGGLWMLPTYAFVLCLTVVVVVGVSRSSVWGAHAFPALALPPGVARQAIAPWLLIRAFAAGCTALTGVEAVSNGVTSFEEPRDRRAKASLTFIISVLAFLLLGISFLAKTYGITAKSPGQAGYESLLSMVTQAVMGRGAFYYLTIASILCVLSLSANTSFAGFPQLCRVLAEDGLMPKAFTARGRRLAYTVGILVLAMLAAVVLVAFGGVTDRLIPLFAIGAFMAFTLSQAGMVGHWRKSTDPRRRLYMIINGVGAVATGATTLVVLVAKFKEGAWLTLALMALTVWMLSSVRRHYDRVARITQVSELRLDPLPRSPMMLVPVSQWNRASMAAVQFACSLSDDVRVLHIAEVDEEGEKICASWRQELDQAAKVSGTRPPRVVAICSPYRSLSRPLLRYVSDAERESPERKIAVVIAEIVAAHWYQHVMHNYHAVFLKLQLFFKADRRVVIVDMPWKLPPAST